MSTSCKNGGGNNNGALVPENNKIIEMLKNMVLKIKYEMEQSTDNNEKKILKYKINQFQKAIYGIKKYDQEIISGYQAQQNVEFVGKGMSTRIDEFLKEGKLKELKGLDKIKKNLIKTDKRKVKINALEGVTGIGPVKAKELMTNHDIKSVNELRKAVEHGKITVTHHTMIGLKYYEDFLERIPRKEVTKFEKKIKNILTKKFGYDYIMTVTGSYRRGKETCGDIDILMTNPKATTAEKMEKQYNTFLPQLLEVLHKKGILIDDLTSLGSSKYMGVGKLGENGKARRIDIRFIPYNSYYPALLYFTGSKDFNIMMRNNAIEQGYLLSEYGLYKNPDRKKKLTSKELASKNKLIFHSEEEIFNALGMDYVPPTDRNI